MLKAAFFSAFLTVAAKAQSGMFVESYWESWVLKDFPDDYCALLKDVPASPVGSLSGVNWVDIGRASNE